MISVATGCNGAYKQAMPARHKTYCPCGSEATIQDGHSGQHCSRCHEIERRYRAMHVARHNGPIEPTDDEQDHYLYGTTQVVERRFRAWTVRRGIRTREWNA